MRLPACPHSPNCVSSTDAKDIAHFILPFQYSGTLQEAKSRLHKILQVMPRTKIVDEKEDYIHVECTSLIFRFVDDLEFWFSESEQLIHVRSASRVGYSDLGVNRKRVEKIRSHFARHR